MNQLIRSLGLKISGLLGIGRVVGLNDSGVTQKVQYQTPLEVADAVRLAEFGFSSSLPVGSDVVLAFLGGDRSNPVIIASNHQTYRHRGLNPGESVIYDQAGKFIHLSADGIYIEANGEDVFIRNAKKIEATATESVKLITPTLLVTGDIIDNCETNGSTLKQLRDAHNDHDHVTKKVQRGNDDATSEKTGAQVNE